MWLDLIAISLAAAIVFNVLALMMQDTPWRKVAGPMEPFDGPDGHRGMRGL